MTGREIATCGVLCALAEAFLLLGGVIPLATYCAPLLAMAALLPVLSEYGTRAAATAYAATALLALMLVADRETALVYVFFGWYPLLRPKIAGLRSAVARVSCRVGVCLGCLSALYGVVAKVLGLEEALSPPLAALLLLLGVGTFLLMDLALGRLTFLWTHRLRRRFFK